MTDTLATVLAIVASGASLTGLVLWLDAHGRRMRDDAQDGRD